MYVRASTGASLKTNGHTNSNSRGGGGDDGHRPGHRPPFVARAPKNGIHRSPPAPMPMPPPRGSCARKSVSRGSPFHRARIGVGGSRGATSSCPPSADADDGISTSTDAASSSSNSIPSSTATDAASSSSSSPSRMNGEHSPSSPAVAAAVNGFRTSSHRPPPPRAVRACDLRSPDLPPSKCLLMRMCVFCYVDFLPSFCAFELFHVRIPCGCALRNWFCKVDLNTWPLHPLQYLLC